MLFAVHIFCRFVEFCFFPFMCHIASTSWPSHCLHPFLQDYVFWIDKMNCSWEIMEPKFQASEEKTLGLWSLELYGLGATRPLGNYQTFIDRHSHPWLLLVYYVKKRYIYIARIGRKTIECSTICTTLHFWNNIMLVYFRISNVFLEPRPAL